MAVTFVLVEMAIGMAPSYALYAASLPIMGLITILTMTAGNASIQLGVDPRLRGRVMALYIMLLMGGTPIGAPILGWLGEIMGARWTLIGGGAVTVIGVVGSVLVMQIYLLRRARQAAAQGARSQRGLDPRRDTAASSEPSFP
jgi:predicted MFS family arabinose efflux permease